MELSDTTATFQGCARSTDGSLGAGVASDVPHQRRHYFFGPGGAGGGLSDRVDRAVRGPVTLSRRLTRGFSVVLTYVGSLEIGLDVISHNRVSASRLPPRPLNLFLLI